MKSKLLVVFFVVFSVLFLGAYDTKTMGHFLYNCLDIDVFESGLKNVSNFFKLEPIKNSDFYCVKNENFCAIYVVNYKNIDNSLYSVMYSTKKDLIHMFFSYNLNKKNIIKKLGTPDMEENPCKIIYITKNEGCLSLYFDNSILSWIIYNPPPIDY